MSFVEWISRAKAIDKLKHTDHEVEAYLKEMAQIRSGKRSFKVTEEQHKTYVNGRNKWKNLINQNMYRSIR